MVTGIIVVVIFVAVAALMISKKLPTVHIQHRLVFIWTKR